MKRKKPETQNASADARGVDRACAGTPGAAVEKDATPSNTASNNCNSDDLRFVPLRWGVDSLYLSYPGMLADSVKNKLDSLKKIAQSEVEADQVSAQYPIDEHIFEVKDKGSGVFPYILRDNAYRISLSRPSSSSVPMAYVQVSSHMLAAYTPQQTETRLRSILEQMGDIEEVRVSRVDLFVDFVCAVNMESWTRHAWVTRAHDIQSFSIKGRFSGWSIGVKGVLSARLYDKTLEIETSGKEYLKGLWREAGWDGEQPVWRLEFEFKREVVTQKGLSSLNDVMGHLDGLWGYATGEWLRLTLPNGEDATRSRWPVHPLWACLASIDWGVSGGPLVKRFSPVTVPTERFILSRLFSSLTTLMALRVVFNLSDAYSDLSSVMAEYLLDRCMFEGVHPDQYVEEQVRIKARRFNTALNAEAGSPGDEGDEYLRRSRGW